MFVVFDLDGTLSDLSHRLHHIKGEKKDWAAFHSSCVDDTPKWPVIRTLFAHISSGHMVEVWSGRSDEVRVETEDWFYQHSIPRPILRRMRKAGDFTPDHELKQSWLDEAKRRPDLVYDDRQRVVDMWRANGIICAQVAQWSETTK